MASPTVPTTAESAVTTSGTSQLITLPSGLASGDLCVIFCGIATAGTFNALTGWTELVDTNAANAEKILYRWCDGTEGSSVTFTASASTRSASLAWRISGAENPATQAPESSTVATGTSTTPDATVVTPTGGSKDYLFLATFVQAGEEADDDTWGGAAPTSYSGAMYKTCGTAGAVTLNVSVGGAQRALTASSDNAGPWGAMAQSLAWRAWTIAIHPAAATPATATPSTIASVGTLPAPTLRAQGRPDPSTIAAVATIGTVTIPTPGQPISEFGHRALQRRIMILETGYVGSTLTGLDELGHHVFQLEPHPRPATLPVVTSMGAVTVVGTVEIDQSEIGISVDIPQPAIQILPGAQKARPDGTQQAGSWTDQAGGTTNIWQTLDETSASDADYVKSPVDAVNAELIVTLAGPEDPDASTGHIVRFRYRRA